MRFEFPTYAFPTASGVVMLGPWDGIPRELLAEQSSASDTQLTCCALNEPLRFGYGRCRVGALLLLPVTSGDDLLVPFVVARGPIDAIEAVEIGNEDPPSGVSSTLYLGGADNVVDPWLQAAWTAQGKIYADTLPGISWGVLKLRRWVGADVLSDIAITARMLKVYDPRDGTQTLGVASTYKWSANPVLALADFITSTAYGRGETLDWSSVTTCADIADQVPSGGTAKRRAFGLMFDSVMQLDDVEETLRAYAGVWVVREGATVRLVADAPTTSTFAFTNAAGSANYVADSVRIVQRGRNDTPTVVTVKWTDTAVKPWREETYTYPESGPGVGVPYREEVVMMPGIQDPGFAKREAIRRLNGRTLSDLTVQLTGLGEAVTLRKGDVVTVTDSYGFTAKPFRLIGHALIEPGRWRETLEEYDAGFYSDALGAEPENPDTTFPLPSDPPTPTGLTLAEEIYQLADGTYSSRIRAEWDVDSWPFTHSFLVTVTQGATVIRSENVGSATSYASPPVQEDVAYNVDVVRISTTAAVSTAATASITPLGKGIPPGDVASFTGFEAGGKAYLYWQAAVDIDVWRYEIRVGTTGNTWDEATLLDRVDGLTYIAEGIASGTKRFQIKAVDSQRNYSANAATLDVTISLDSNAFVVESRTLLGVATSPTANVTAYTAGGVKWWATDFGDGIGYGYTNTNNATGLITDDSLGGVVVAHPHTAGTSTLVSEAWDIGATVTGNATVTATYTDVSGTAALVVETSTNGSSWTTASSNSTRATFRYLRGKISTTGTMIVRDGFAARTDIVPKSEQGTVTTSASAAVTVSLVNKYSQAKSIQLTPKKNGSYPGLTSVYDAVTLSLTGANSFTVYCFDGSTQLANEVYYRFDGI